ncbi:hypothetical protein RFI_14610 [Reticulomyxa filosa]|uniref:Uncharacterized protein n=1 Tax=Reticulomyxa filosa TaxID=46433 RepID=X6N8H8_RETFI|nr:hypothetical protein RFI_14610 [Reticulomyxa filosa]|eukprot:ETO22585.1 hypothetical protein RFI_14610 [Reticulomyxa filosa]
MEAQSVSHDKLVSRLPSSQCQSPRSVDNTNSSWQIYSEKLTNDEHCKVSLLSQSSNSDRSSNFSSVENLANVSDIDRLQKMKDDCKEVEVTSCAIRDIASEPLDVELIADICSEVTNTLLFSPTKNPLSSCSEFENNVSRCLEFVNTENASNNMLAKLKRDESLHLSTLNIVSPADILSCFSNLTEITTQITTCLNDTNHLVLDNNKTLQNHNSSSNLISFSDKELDLKLQVGLKRKNRNKFLTDLVCEPIYQMKEALTLKKWWDDENDRNLKKHNQKHAIELLTQKQKIIIHARKNEKKEYLKENLRCERQQKALQCLKEAQHCWQTANFPVENRKRRRNDTLEYWPSMIHQLVLSRNSQINQDQRLRLCNIAEVAEMQSTLIKQWHKNQTKIIPNNDQQKANQITAIDILNKELINLHKVHKQDNLTEIRNNQIKQLTQLQKQRQKQLQGPLIFYATQNTKVSSFHSLHAVCEHGRLANRKRALQLIIARHKELNDSCIRFRKKQSKKISNLELINQIVELERLERIEHGLMYFHDIEKKCHNYLSIEKKKQNKKSKTLLDERVLNLWKERYCPKSNKGVTNLIETQSKLPGSKKTPIDWKFIIDVQNLKKRNLLKIMKESKFSQHLKKEKLKESVKIVQQPERKVRKTSHSESAPLITKTLKRGQTDKKLATPKHIVQPKTLKQHEDSQNKIAQDVQIPMIFGRLYSASLKRKIRDDTKEWIKNQSKECTFQPKICRSARSSYRNHVQAIKQHAETFNRLYFDAENRVKKHNMWKQMVDAYRQQYLEQTCTFKPHVN